MKIGVNTLFYIPGEVGGSETYLKETLRALARDFPDRHLVLFTNLENHDELAALLAGNPQVELQRLAFRATNRFARIVREQTELPRRARRAGIDVLWSPGYTAPVRAPCPQAVSILDMQYKRHPEDLTWLARLTTDVLIKIAARRCRAILTLSDFSKREIVTFTSFPAERIHVTPLAAEPPAALPLEDAEVRRRVELLLPGNAPYVLSVANSYPHKNLHALVEAFARLAAEIPHRLLLVGKPRLGEPLLQRALAQLGDQHARVTRLAWVGREDLFALYRGAAAFVFPSLYEGFGLPVLEAMQAGTPVLTTRRGAIPEVAGDAAVYFDPAQPDDLAAQLRNLLAWPAAQRADWIARARRHAAAFSWHQTAVATLRGLEEVAALAG